MRTGILLAVGAVLLALQDGPPRFEDYLVHESYRGRPVPVILTSHPDARLYRTRLRNGARQGPNFAGRFTVVTWRAGFPYGVMLAVVSAETGKVTFGPDLMFGADYRLDSSLLIADPPERVRAYFETDTTDNLRFAATTIYYKWDGERFVPLDSIPVYPQRGP
jgi:hypothetical protein